MKGDSRIKDIIPAELFLREKLQYKHDLYSMSYNLHGKEMMNASAEGKAFDWTPVRHRDKDQIHGNQDSLAGLSQNFLLFSPPGFLIVALGLGFFLCVLALFSFFFLLSFSFFLF